jgi:hypothetical protein
MAILQIFETLLGSIATFFTLEAKLQFGLNLSEVKCNFPLNKVVNIDLFNSSYNLLHAYPY